ncbi:MAG: FlgD immunoglobulin-like domain containing protein [bacterium]
MNAALGLLLIAQLNSFEFDSVFTPQVVGDSFPVTIVARDGSGGIYPYNGNALLSTSLGAYVYPNIAEFQNGVWQGRVIVTLAENLSLRCIGPQASGESNTFGVVPGPPDRLLVILPGERAAPGSPSGRLPNPPLNQSAGEQFDVTVYLTDKWHNTVPARNDSVRFSSSDNFANIPAGRLANGSGSFPAVLRAAGTQRVFCLPASSSQVSADTSSPLTIVPGGYERLLVVLPGEANLPGDNTTEPGQTPGKNGSPNDQFLRRLFPVTVYGCDQCWNIVRVTTDSVRLNSDAPFGSTPPALALGDGAVFDVEFLEAGPRQGIWATSASGGESYVSRFTVRPLVVMLEVDVPDTVRAGETAYVRVTMRDGNEAPVVAAPCYFSVTAGNGEMLDPVLLSDTIGRATARFLCDRARGDEHDTIKVFADTTAYAGIFVTMPDSMLLDGDIVIFPNPFGFNQDRAEIIYFLRNAAPVTVTIYDTFGNEVCNWRFSTRETGALAGVNRIWWDGRNSKGRRVANGIYVVQVIGQLHTGTVFKAARQVGVVW